MFKKLFILIFAPLVFILPNCSLKTLRNSQTKAETETSPAAQTAQNKNETQSGAVNFKGVSFDYDPQVFAEVKLEEEAEVPLQDETDKPDYIHPQQIVFTLKNKNAREIKIIVFALEDYRRVWSAVEKNDIKSLDKNLENFKKTAKDIKPYHGKEMPYLPFIDASQSFVAKVESFPFQNGKGFFFLTQFDQDYANPVNNDDLTYIYQGISDDGKQYILAEFPVTGSFLPANADTESEDYKRPTNASEYKTIVKFYPKYLAKITKKLEDLKPSGFEPDLDSIKKIISSLKVEK